MNFYFDAAKIIDRLDAKHGSVKSLLNTLPEKSRKRTAALVIETLKCRRTPCRALIDYCSTHTLTRSPLDKPALAEAIAAANLLKEEKKITSRSLALVLVHDLLLAGGIQAGDGPVKQALLRHKTRLRGEWQRLKIKRGAKTDGEMALADDVRAGRLAVLFSFVLDGDENFSAKLDRIPRYARINALKWTVDEAIMAFQKSGYVLGNPLDGMYVVHPYRLKLPTRALFPSVTPHPFSGTSHGMRTSKTCCCFTRSRS